MSIFDDPTIKAFMQDQEKNNPIVKKYMKHKTSNNAPSISAIICKQCTHTEFRDYNYHKMYCCTLTGKPEYKSQCIEFRPKNMIEEKRDEINR